MMSNIEKKTETIEGKRPWDAGFAKEEYEQKAAYREKVGDKRDAIKNSLLAESTQARKP